MTKLWNTATDPEGSNYFLKNNVALPMRVADKSNTVAAGDKLYCCVFVDETTWSDAISYFQSTAVTAEAGKAFTLNLQGGSSMAVDGYNPGSIAGAQVGTWEKGVFTPIDGAVTDADGNVTLTLNEEGTYIVSANGSVRTQIANWGGGNGGDVITVDASLTAPYCIVTVNPATAVTATVSFNAQIGGGFLAPPRRRHGGFQ